jgi:TRAP-type C4-dicarboxylate transport system permease small subunit
MPKLIRLYIVNVAIGFALAVVFVALLVITDVANLRHLILDTEMGYLAAAMMVMFNGVVFAGVQFAIAVMRLAEPDEGPRGGRKMPLGALQPILVEARARR